LRRKSTDKEEKMRRITMLALLVSAFTLAACGEKKDEPKADEPKADDVKADEAKPDEAKPEEKAVEAKPEEAKPEEKADEEAKPEEAAADEGEAPKVDDVLTLAIEGAKKPAIKFPHKAHTGFEPVGGKCDKCHHMAGDDAASIKGCMAEGCHDGKAEGVPGPKDAFHKTCKDGCHKDVIKAGKSDKLKKVNTCSGCHAKE